jgi:2-polyprenyl-6-methoxyphenol hydroxylase-like FAD-dependent oxidoreductase
VRSNIEGHYMKSLARFAPSLAGRVRDAHRVERFYGMSNLPNFFRKPFGPGWALVGDAGYHKDPITAQGMTDAFHSAHLLAHALDEGLGGARPLHQSLAHYQRQRDEAALPMYELTCQLAMLAPPSLEMQQLFAALRWTKLETDRFFGTIAGTIPITRFFSPRNIRRITLAPENYFPSTSDMRYIPAP